MANAIQALKSALADPTSHEKIRTAFNMYDLDGKGILNRIEFGEFAKHLLSILESSEDAALITKQFEADSPAQFADKLFNKSDLNEDKVISFSEFESIVLSF
jgi:Ca2+-binding EF-hand superfamily protein